MKKSLLVIAFALFIVSANTLISESKTSVTFTKPTVQVNKSGDSVVDKVKKDYNNAKNNLKNDVEKAKADTQAKQTEYKKQIEKSKADAKAKQEASQKEAAKKKAQRQEAIKNFKDSFK